VLFKMEVSSLDQLFGPRFSIGTQQLVDGSLEHWKGLGTRNYVCRLKRVFSVDCSDQERRCGAYADRSSKVLVSSNRRRLLFKTKALCEGARIQSDGRRVTGQIRSR
jgi:hypothetical protein